MSEYLEKNVISSASIILTEWCNLSCSYCYQPSSRLKKFMTPEMAEKIVDFLIEGALNGPADNNKKKGINLTFFGGEPTLNVRTMRHMFDYAYINTQKNNLMMDCMLITNCTIWNDELERFLTHWTKTLGKCRVQLSIDGIPEVLNHNRKHSDPNVDVSKEIEAVCNKYTEFWKKYDINPDLLCGHGCISKFSLPFVKQSYDYMRDTLGLNRIWFMPVHEEPWDENDVKIFEREYRLIASRIYEECINSNSSKPYNSFSSFECHLDSQRMSKSCSAGCNYCSFDSDGNIYPCHKFKYPLDNSWIMGHVDVGIKMDDYNKFKDISMKNMFALNNCSECPNNHCKICLAMNHEFNKELEKGFPRYCLLSIKEDEIRWELRRLLEERGLINLLSSVERTNNGYNLEELKKMFNKLTDELSADVTSFKELAVKDINKTICKLSDENYEIMTAVSNLTNIVSELMQRYNTQQADINLIKHRIDTLIHGE